MEPEANPSPSPNGDPGATSDGGVNPQPDILVDPGTTDPWYSTLQDEGLRGNPSLTRYKTVDDLAKGHVELERKIGQKQGVELPGEDATPEQWSDFYSRVGRPATPDDYNVAPPEFAEGMPSVSPEKFEEFLGVAHKAGLRNDQLAPLLEWFQGYNTELWQGLQEGEQGQKDAGYQSLRKTWGALTDRNMAIAMEGLRRDFGDDLSFVESIVTKNGDGQPQFLGNSPQFVQMAYELARLKGHDRFVGGGPSGAGSPQAARDRIDAARKEMHEGKITSEQFSSLQQRFGPLAYSEGEGDFQVGTLTSVDIPKE